MGQTLTLSKNHYQSNYTAQTNIVTPVTISPITDTPVCGETNFTGSSGNLSSPNFPYFYPDKVVCLYTIVAPPGTQVGV